MASLEVTNKPLGPERSPLNNGNYLQLTREFFFSTRGGTQDIQHVRQILCQWARLLSPTRKYLNVLIQDHDTAFQTWLGPNSVYTFIKQHIVSVWVIWQRSEIGNENLPRLSGICEGREEHNGKYPGFSHIFIWTSQSLLHRALHTTGVFLPWWKQPSGQHHLCFFVLVRRRHVAHPVPSGAMPWTLYCLLLGQLSIPGKQCLPLHCFVLTLCTVTAVTCSIVPWLSTSALAPFVVLITFSLLW